MKCIPLTTEETTGLHRANHNSLCRQSMQYIQVVPHKIHMLSFVI